MRRNTPSIVGMLQRLRYQISVASGLLAGTAFVLFLATDEALLAMTLAVVAVSIMMVVTVLSFVHTVSEPRALFITLLGVGRTGKTVYLGVLFDILRRWQGRDLTFRPYGDETITMMTDIMNTLALRRWPSPTPQDKVFPFRAQVRYSSGGRTRHYKIFMPDYAGDETEQFQKGAEEPLLHKSPFFRQVVESDAVILVADGAILSGGNKSRIKVHENNLMAAVSRLVDVKGGRRGKIAAPVAIMITKADLYAPGHPLVLDRLKDLVALCEETCKNFAVFEVSSVGAVDGNGDPLAQLLPERVVDPVLWLLVRLSALPLSAYSNRDEAVILDAIATPPVEDD